MIKRGFSLMEMMVVLLIVAIIAAASAPLVNKKIMDRMSSKTPWVWNAGNSIAFGFNNSSQKVLIGRAAAPEGQNAKLYIETPSNGSLPQIALGSGNDEPFKLWVTKDGGISLTKRTDKPHDKAILIGDTSNSAKDAVAIGNSTIVNEGSVSIGTGAVTRSGALVAIGHSATALKSGAISIGEAANSRPEEYTLPAGLNYNNAIAIGKQAFSLTDAIAVGTFAQADGNKAVSIGTGATANAENAVAVGANARSDKEGVAIGSGAAANDDNPTTAARAGENSVAIGYNARTIAKDNGATVLGSGAVAIGHGAHTEGNNAVAIGRTVGAAEGSVAIGTYGRALGAPDVAPEGPSIANAPGSVAIGQAARAYGDHNPIAIGKGALATYGSVAIGGSAGTNNSNATVIGVGASVSGTNATAIGQGAEAYDDGISIGQGAKHVGSNITGGIAIGHNAKVTASNAIAIGNSVVASENQIVLGTSSHRARIPSTSVSIGTEDFAGDNQILLGNANTTVKVPGTLELGNLDFLKTPNAIQLGNGNSTITIPGNLIIKGNVQLATGENLPGDAVAGNVAPSVYLRAYDISANQSYMGRVVEYNGYVIGVQPEVKGPSTSDRRLKNVGEVFTGGLAELKKLELFHYTYKKDPDKTPQVGIMAQDLQKVFPTAVFEGKDGFLRIRWDEMFFALINAVKELDAKIDKIIAEHKRVIALEKDVADWKKQNLELEDDIKDLSRQFEDMQKDIARLKKKKKS